VENVPGFVNQRGGLRRVLGELAEDGWSCHYAIVSASDAGAPHLRKRVWILATRHGGYPCREVMRLRDLANPAAPFSSRD
jgi:DNA (cytosine-5)-methyltransferase 1